ncbi:MAG TPA: hypothetical protein VJ643_00705 [Nitrososphaera sp.]|nr:hypothetical protein [Nitrososphaera sp.]
MPFETLVYVNKRTLLSIKSHKLGNSKINSSGNSISNPVTVAIHIERSSGNKKRLTIATTTFTTIATTTSTSRMIRVFN